MIVRLFEEHLYIYYTILCNRIKGLKIMVACQTGQMANTTPKYSHDVQKNKTQLLKTKNLQRKWAQFT